MAPLIYMQVRALGSVGYVLITSFLIRENIFALVIHSPSSDISLMQYQDSSCIFLWDPFCLQITINIHASLTFIFTAAGIYTVPSMEAIYALFSILVSSTTLLIHSLSPASVTLNHWSFACLNRFLLIAHPSHSCCTYCMLPSFPGLGWKHLWDCQDGWRKQSNSIGGINWIIIDV